MSRIKLIEASINGAGQVVPLSEVRMKQPVPFNGPSSLTLLAKEGTLNFYPEMGVITAERAGREPLIIPLTSVSFMREMPEPKEEPKAPPPPPPAPEPAKADVVKFEKNAAGEIREVAKKIAAVSADLGKPEKK